MEMEMTINKNTDIQVFAERFPSPQEVLNVFSPSNWGMFLREQDRCTNAPNVTLAKLSEYYDTSTSTQLVVNQYRGIFDLASANEYNEKGVRMAADIFLSNYEHELTPYSTMLYFGRYSSLYKSSYRDFDLQDILLQCRKKFLPWWNQMKAQQAERQAQAEQQTKGVTLQEAIVRWMMKGETVESIKGGGLYELGRINDAMIETAKAEYRKRQEAEAF